MSTSCAHRFSKVTRQPARGPEIGSGTCVTCNTRLCVHDFLDKRVRTASVTYRFAHPLSSAAVSSCAICRGGPRASGFEQQRLQPWFDGEGPALPPGWYFAGKTEAADDTMP